MKTFFEQNKDKFDVYEPKNGHQERFLSKIKAHQKPKRLFVSYKWQVAAAVLLIIGLLWQTGLYVRQMQTNNTEIRQNEKYFSMIIKEELEAVQNEKTPETEKVFNDAMQQIKLLENDYQKLIDAYRQNKDKYILNAMIENFQQRIQILQFVKQQIKQIKKTKTNQNEKHRV